MITSDPARRFPSWASLVLLYPSVSNYWNSITQSRAIVDYDTIVKSLSPKDYTAYFERAEEYNSELKALPFPLMEYQQISGYDDCLNAAGDGVIGYIDIDKIQVKLPIYHGTDPSILNRCLRTYQGSSFPIAGKGPMRLSRHTGACPAQSCSRIWTSWRWATPSGSRCLDKAFTL